MCFFRRPKPMPLEEVSFDTCVYRDKWKSDETIDIHAVNLGLQCWHSSGYEVIRCYISCQATMPPDSKRRSRGYELGWIGPYGETGGVNTEKEFRWGNATPEQQRAVIFAARAAIKAMPLTDPDEEVDDGEGDDEDDDPDD